MNDSFDCIVCRYTQKYICIVFMQILLHSFWLVDIDENSGFLYFLHENREILYRKQIIREQNETSILNITKSNSNNNRVTSKATKTIWQILYVST